MVIIIIPDTQIIQNQILKTGILPLNKKNKPKKYNSQTAVIANQIYNFSVLFIGSLPGYPGDA